MRGQYLLVLAVLLAGCTSDDEFIDHAVEQARTACEAQGKQFILKSRPQLSSGELLDRDIEIDAACVGTDDAVSKPAKS